jgi:DNA-directed RNA polymerase specialized sigma subunit
MKENPHKEILTDIYKNMQKLIAKAAWDFWSVYGGDIDDVIAQANLIFIDAFSTYDSSRSEITTWLTFKIKKGLLDYMRSGNLRESSNIKIDSVFAETYPASKKDISIMEFLDELNEDAHVVLQLFFETPSEVLVDIQNSSRRIDHARAHIRRRLMNRLRQMGWTVKRMNKAFGMIKSVSSY